MSERNLHIQINLNALRAQLQRSLQKTMLLVAAGLQNLDEIKAAGLELPTPIKLRVEPGLIWNDEEARILYEEWVLRNGFRDAVESLGSFLEEANRVLTVWNRLEKPDNQIVIKGDEWQRLVTLGQGKFHWLGLPDKLGSLRDEHNVVLDETLYAHALSINAARNCLVHRGGVVANADAKEKGRLTVTWRRINIFLRDEAGEKPLPVGGRVEANSEVYVRHEDMAKSFMPGQSITFSTQEFADISWSLWLLGENLVTQINARGLERGFLKETA